MFRGPGLILTSVVLSQIEITVLTYQQDNCADDNPTEVSIPATWTTCDSFLGEQITTCENDGHDFCDQYQFYTCFSITGTTYRSFMWECISCEDGIMNGDEEGVDCGGYCSLACPLDCTYMSCDEGQGYVLKDNADTLFCGGDPCSYQDTDTCCDRKALCSTFSIETTVNCLDDSYLADSAYCAGTVCEVSDQDTCCIKRATCENYDADWCDFNRFLYDNLDQVYCDYDVCNQWEDQYNCCALKPFCSTMSCDYDNGLTLITDHAEVMCETLTCDADTCCTERASCADMNCYVWDIYVYKPSWYSEDSWLCHGATCSTDWDSPDWNYCCLEKETCKNDDSTYPCPENNALVDDPTNVHCPNLTCYSPEDDKTCCGPSKCTNDDIVICNSNTHYVDESAYCADLTCTLQDEAECCIGSSCSEYSGCDSGTQVTNLNRNCELIACSSSDHDTCCENRAPCTEFDCPACETPVDSGLCAGTSCVSTDSETCSCVERGLDINETVGRYVNWAFWSESGNSGTFEDLESTKTLVAEFFDIPCRWVMQVEEVCRPAPSCQAGVDITYTIFLSTANSQSDYGELLFEMGFGLNSYEWALALSNFTNGEWGFGYLILCSNAYEVDYTPGGSGGSHSAGLSVGAIIGIVVGALVLAAVIGIVICKHRTKRL